jgi:hypothetical protein
MTMPKNETLVVLKPPRATIDVVRAARKNNWRHVKRIDPGERRFYEEIYEVPDTGTVVRVIDDHFVQIIYVALQGEGRQQVESTLRKQVETLEDTAIDALLKSQNPKDRATGIRILGAIAPDIADNRITEAFSKALEDKSPEVFKALIAAVGRAAWPELWPIVDDLAKTGKPEAEDLQKAYERHIPRPQ